MKCLTRSGKYILLLLLFGQCEVPLPADSRIKAAVASYILEASIRSSATQPFHIFITDRFVANGVLASVQDGDRICNASPRKPSNGVFRAMMAAQGKRIGSVTSGMGDGQIDWVLGPNREYARSDGTRIGKTNAHALFDFPLRNSITEDAGFTWTGLNSDWTRGLNCNDWGDFSALTTIGQPASTLSGMLNDSSAVGTFMSASLVCIERDEAPLRVYVTTAGYIPGSDFFSAANADARCMGDMAYPGTGIFKALIASPLRAVSPLEMDWVLKPFRTYVRASDGQVIQTADSSAVWRFPLQHSVGTLGNSAWTGLRSNWTRYTGSSETCNDWTSASGTGVVSNNLETAQAAIDNGPAGCNLNFTLICVEQP